MPRKKQVAPSEPTRKSRRQAGLAPESLDEEQESPQTKNQSTKKTSAAEPKKLSKDKDKENNQSSVAKKTKIQQIVSLKKKGTKTGTEKNTRASKESPEKEKAEAPTTSTTRGKATQNGSKKQQRNRPPRDDDSSDNNSSDNDSSDDNSSDNNSSDNNSSDNNSSDNNSSDNNSSDHNSSDNNSSDDDSSDDDSDEPGPVAMALDSNSEAGPSKEPRNDENQEEGDSEENSEKTSEDVNMDSESESEEDTSTRKTWGWESEKTRRKHPIMQRPTKKVFNWNHVILRFDPDGKSREPIQGLIRYIVSRGYLFVVLPSLRRKSMGLERAVLMKGSEYPEAKQRFIDGGGMTVSSSDPSSLANTDWQSFKVNNVATTLDGKMTLVEGYSGDSRAKEMKILSISTLRAAYGRAQADALVLLRRVSVGQTKLVQKEKKQNLPLDVAEFLTAHRLENV